MPAIWRLTKEDGIYAPHYRLIWWLVDAGLLQKGSLPSGWIAACADQLGCHRSTLRKWVMRLVEHKVLTTTAKGQVSFNPEGFESEAFIPARGHARKPDLWPE
jgi:hypothetical protein